MAERPQNKWTGEVTFIPIKGLRADTKLGTLVVHIGENGMVRIQTKSSRTGHKTDLGLSREASMALVAMLIELMPDEFQPKPPTTTEP